MCGDRKSTELVGLFGWLHRYNIMTGKMTMRRTLALTAAVAVVACSSSGEASDPAVSFFRTSNGATVEVTALGGIAGAREHQLVRRDDRTYATSLRYGSGSGSALDTASGTLSAAAADSLFDIIFEQSPFSLQDDYGDTHGAADAMIYTLVVTADGRTKAIHADDVTMPPQMRRIVESVRGTISAARR